MTGEQLAKALADAWTKEARGEWNGTNTGEYGGGSKGLPSFLSTWNVADKALKEGAFFVAKCLV